jgi:hypothetical protein
MEEQKKKKSCQKETNKSKLTHVTILTNMVNLNSQRSDFCQKQLQEFK